MRLIDISHELTRSTPVFPGECATAFIPSATLTHDGYNACILRTSLHTGTHIDMPMHMTEDSKAAKSFPLDCFCGKGVLMDVRGESVIEMKPAYERMVNEKEVMLLLTGFDKYYGEEKYFNSHPVLSGDFQEFLLSQHIKMLGMDMPGPDYAPYTFHRMLLSRGIFCLENLNNLNSLVGIEEFEVMALPLKIDAEASLVRAVCVVSGEDCRH